MESTVTLRVQLGLIRLRRKVAAVLGERPTADRASLVAWAARSDGHHQALVREVETFTRQHLSLATFRRAEDILDEIGADPMVVTRLRTQLKADFPRLFYPYMHDMRSGTRVRGALMSAIACDDVSGADLSVLYEAALWPQKPEYLSLVVDYMLEHDADTDVPTRPAPSHVERLVEMFEGDAETRSADIASWANDHDEAVFAYRTAIALQDVPMLELLRPSIEVEEMTNRQRARAASLLWRGGDEKIALQFAYAVEQRGRIGRRARSILDEHEAFVFQDSGWVPPPLAKTPIYTPNKGTILHVLHNALPYRATGAANRTQGLLSSLVVNGCSISAVTPPGFPYDDVPADQLDTIVSDWEINNVRYHGLLNDGVVIPRFRLAPFLDAYTAGIIAQAKIDRPALIHSASNAYNALAGTVAARQLGVPNIYEVRGLNEEGRRSRNEAYGLTRQYRFAKHLEILAATEADRVIAITEGLRAELVDRGIDPAKILVVPNGVDTDRFGPLERDEDLARTYGLEGKLVIGYVGSLNWYEGHDLLFEAVRRLHPRHPDMRLLIVGGGQEFDHLMSLRSELGLEDVIIMPGKVPFDQVEAHYSLIDIAPITRSSSPVTETTSPLKPFEAMAMGKTVLSSDVAVMKEVFNGENGLLYTKDDADSLESVLERLLNDEDLRARLGEGGRKWVVAERDWRKLGKRVTDLYTELGAM